MHVNPFGGNRAFNVDGIKQIENNNNPGISFVRKNGPVLLASDKHLKIRITQVSSIITNDCSTG
jgi:hypothetical protein